MSSMAVDNGQNGSKVIDRAARNMRVQAIQARAMRKLGLDSKRLTDQRSLKPTLGLEGPSKEDGKKILKGMLEGLHGSEKINLLNDMMYAESTLGVVKEAARELICVIQVQNDPTRNGNGVII